MSENNQNMSQHSRNVSRGDLPIVDVFEFEGRMVTFHCADLRKSILGAKLLTRRSLPLPEAGSEQPKEGSEQPK